MTKNNKKVKKTKKMDIKKAGVIFMLVATVAMYISALFLV